MIVSNGKEPQPVSSDITDDESEGRGVIVVTLAAALTTLAIILYSLYQFIKGMGDKRL